MKKLAIHLHIYYEEQVDIILQYMKNLADVDYDLFVTVIKSNPIIEQKIKTFNPNSHIWIVENRGYDIGPFIEFLHHINLENYSFIMKLHTKNNKTGHNTYLNQHWLSRKLWFELLIKALLGSPNIISKNIMAFKKNPKLGMISSKYVITSDYPTYAIMLPKINSIMKKLNYAPISKLTFVAGTMFIARSYLMQRIKDNFTINDFAPTDSNVKDGTLSHVLERIFGAITIASGYTIKGFDTKMSLEYNKLLSFLYRKKITKSNHTLIKICKIPVYHHKFKLGK